MRRCSQPMCFRQAQASRAECATHAHRAKKRGTCGSCRRLKELVRHGDLRVCQPCRTKLADQVCVDCGHRPAVYRADPDTARCARCLHRRRAAGPADRRVCVSCGQPNGHHAHGHCNKCHCRRRRRAKGIMQRFKQRTEAKAEGSLNNDITC